MTTTRHTPEPWAVMPGKKSYTIYSKNHADVIRITSGNDPADAPGQSRDIAYRIVDCVNACAGIDDPATAIKGAREVLAELLEASEYSPDDDISNHEYETILADAQKRARKALALLGKGGA